MSELVDASGSSIRLQFIHASAVCFAMEQAGIPFIRDVRVANDGPQPIEGAELGIQLVPELGAEQRFRLPVLVPGEARDVPRPDVRLTPGHLRNVVEREAVQLRVRVYAGGECLVEQRRNVDVFAYNEWPGDRAPLGLLASFVTPNQAALVPLVASARRVLTTTLGSSTIDGYQSRSLNQVLQFVRAAFDCIANLGISYASLPPSFEKTGQKIRLVETVLTDRSANCLDATLLFSALLECFGLRPLIVLLRDHALVGVWLVEDLFPEGIVEDSARLRTNMDLNRLVVLETTMALGGGSIPDAFERAVARARELLKQDTAFVAACDVHALRDDGFRPLSFRSLDGRPGEAPDERESVDLEAARRLLEATTHRQTHTEDDPLPAHPTSPAAQRFQRWKESLLDLTLRNKLLHFRTERRGAVSLDVPDLGQFENLLAADHQFEVLPSASADNKDGRSRELVAARGGGLEAKQRRLSDLANGRVHSPLSPDELSKRALFLERLAKTDLEDGGASTLFVALGLLRWFESAGDEEPKLAPLLLYPAAMRFDRQKRRTTVRKLDDEVSPNQTLIEKMRRDYKVDLSKLGSLDLDESGVDVPAMLNVVRQAIQQMPRWEVLEEAHIGHFKFNKFLMWKDLHENEPELLGNRVVRRIADREDATPISAAPEAQPEELDEQIVPADLPCVLSADSTQMLAMHAALHGTGLVLQGPPGTGKSQTITNLIAAALSRGQTVLFVSEKMAALEVVYRRLRDVGLDEFCLELHSHKTTRKQVVESFARALQVPPPTRQSAWAQSSTDLVQLKQQLNQYVRVLHAPTLLGKSIYEAMGRQLELARYPELGIPLAEPLRLSAEKFLQTRSSVDRFATRAHAVSPCADNPWRWSAQTEWTSAAEEELARVVALLPATVEELDQAAKDLANTLETSVPDDTAAIALLAKHSREIEAELDCLCRETSSGPVPRSALEAAAWPELRTDVHDYTNRKRVHTRVHAGLSTRWTDAFHLEELISLGSIFARWTNAFFLFSLLFLWSPRRRLQRTARARLPSNHQILEDLEAARLAPKEADELRRKEQRLSVELADIWSESIDPDGLDATIARGERARAAWQRLNALPSGALCGPEPLAWASMLQRMRVQRERLESALQVCADAERSFVSLTQPRARVWPDVGASGHRTELASIARRMSHALGGFRDWCLYQREVVNLVAVGLRGLVDAHDVGTVSPDQITGSWERAVLARWRKAAIDAEPSLRNFSVLVQDQTIQKFADQDAAHEVLAREWIRNRLRAGVPRDETARKDSELQRVRREVQKKARHIPIRALLQSIPQLRTVLKPCFLMSPLSVAQFLPARSEFDLVVFDEASQIETHDAIGAIARGKQVVIVGDSRQLPPTRFFSRPKTDEDEPDNENLVDLDSILDEAQARHVPERTLGWHYRSRHDALIEFSNRRYYDDRLQVFPSARNRVADLGIAWHPVPHGVFYSSASRNDTHTNPEEAKALVANLVHSLKHYKPAERTFGVVTFSLAQKEFIDELLDRARETCPEIEKHWSGAEAVFVKNLENVQGDERDEVLFSVAYAKNEKGLVNHNLGPLSKPGGERRLNVAITRARCMLRVFSTLTHDQIDLGRTKARGTEDLRAFLRFAKERGETSESAVSAPTFDSALERDVCNVLVDAGYTVRTKIGCGAYRVDLAVEYRDHPGVFALGIECDGPTYHSAKACRDRDRLRGDVLRGLSWRTYRVWSMAWHFGRDREIAKLLKAVEQACSVSPERALEVPVAETQRGSAELGFLNEPGSVRRDAASESSDCRANSSRMPMAVSGQPRAASRPPSAKVFSHASTELHVVAPATFENAPDGRDESSIQSTLGTFAHYHLEKELRGGGMAQCYRAKDPTTGAAVFLKRVRVGSKHEDSLRRELDIYSKLQCASCENVLLILGQARDDDYVALITEFAEGGDLERHVQAQPHRRLTPVETTAVALSVARGLTQLHGLDIVHRDLKPANVLRTADTWKIADFGIAKDQHRAMPGATFQQAGSYGYAPPEQWAGTNADPSADTFALGKLLAFMLTGGTDPDAIPLECAQLRALAFRCTAHPAKDRPSSLEILEHLERLSLDA